MSRWVPIPPSASWRRSSPSAHAGNPFFAEEIVRELVQRGSSAGERGGDNACRADVAEGEAACLRQRRQPSRRASTGLNRSGQADGERRVGAIGARFGADLLAAAGVDAAVDELAGRGADRSGAARPRPPNTPSDTRRSARWRYESQPKSVSRRAASPARRSHRIGQPGAADQNASLIAEHLEAAGDGEAAYAWHMRAATWSTHRDIAAARVSWERARQIADALSPDHPNRIAMRIAPRTMLCGAGWRVDAHIADHFQELREVVRSFRRQGIAGPWHDRHGDGSHDACPPARGIAAGVRTDGAARLDRRSGPDGWGGVHGDARQIPNR